MRCEPVGGFHNHNGSVVSYQFKLDKGAKAFYKLDLPYAPRSSVSRPTSNRQTVDNAKSSERRCLSCVQMQCATSVSTHTRKTNPPLSSVVVSRAIPLSDPPRADRSPILQATFSAGQHLTFCRTLRVST